MKYMMINTLKGFTGGTQYCKKTGYTLKEFYEEYKKQGKV